jgi:hypothetical protein
MTYAIDEMAPIMWVFIIILLIAVVISLIRFVYIWVASDPCAAYDMMAFWWGKVGEHCVR